MRIRSRSLAVFPLIAVVLSMGIALGLAQDESSTVASQMKAINKNFRELRRQLKDPAMKEANLALIQDVKMNLKKAKNGEPSKTASLPQSERGPFLDAYRALLDEVISNVEKLEQAVNDDQWDQAEALVEKLNEQKKLGHSKFQD